MRYILAALTLCFAQDMYIGANLEAVQIKDMRMTEREQSFASHLTGDAIEPFIMMDHDMRTRAMDLAEKDKLSPNDAVMKTMSQPVPPKS